MRERVLLSSPQAASAFDPPTWTSFTHPKGVSGIWGLHDKLVFAWGGLNIRPHLSRWDGQTWTEESIVETQDGDSFESMPIDLFRDLIRSTPPLWKR